MLYFFSFWFNESRDNASWMHWISPALAPVHMISYGMSHVRTLCCLNIWSNCDISCVANCSCLRSHPCFTMTWINFQVVKPPKGEASLILSHLSSKVSPKIRWIEMSTFASSFLVSLFPVSSPFSP